MTRIGHVGDVECAERKSPVRNSLTVGSCCKEALWQMEKVADPFSGFVWWEAR